MLAYVDVFAKNSNTISNSISLINDILIKGALDNFSLIHNFF